MSFRTDSWITLQLSASSLEKMEVFQQGFINQRGAPPSSSQIVKEFFFEAVTSAVLDKGLTAAFKLTNIPSAVLTLTNLSINMIHLTDELSIAEEYRQLVAGLQAVTDVKNYLKSNADFRLVEVTFRQRIYIDPTTGQQIGMILGNPSDIKAAYEIKRVLLSNGNWLAK